MQRPGLFLMDGTVFAGFGGICDKPNYRGWVAAVPEDGTSFPSTLWTTETQPGGSPDGAVWMTSAPIVSDNPALHQLLISTGNGSSPAPGAGNPFSGTLAASVVRLTYHTDTHVLTSSDFFSPWNSQALSDVDLDIGSTGVLPLCRVTGGVRRLCPTSRSPPPRGARSSC